MKRETIKRGRSYNYGFPRIEKNKRGFILDFNFNEGLLSLEDNQQSIHKIGGWSYRLLPKIDNDTLLIGHHWMSIRAGFQVINDVITVSCYYYRTGLRFDFPMLEGINFMCDYRMVVMLQDNGMEAKVKLLSYCMNSVRDEFEGGIGFPQRFTSNYGYGLGFALGGNMKAEKDVFIESDLITF